MVLTSSRTMEALDWVGTWKGPNDSEIQVLCRKVHSKIQARQTDG